MTVHAGPLDLVFPTPNQALFSGGGPAFYQYVDRDFKGEKSRPWQAGQYGFVRNPTETSQGLVYRRFHEGLDIRAVERDEKGIPQDRVVSIDRGRVVHANTVSGYSNYGKYVVIEHSWGGCNYYSLYAHLREVHVKKGDSVRRGEAIGLLGWTGSGTNVRRAHVHFEINLMLSRKFEAWHKRYFPRETNRHGLFNGLNLIGMDAAKLYLALRENPALTIPVFLGGEKPFYKVTVPATRNFVLRRHYPWMAGVDVHKQPPSWEISFTRSGLPVKIRASGRRVGKPTLTQIEPSRVPYVYLTRGLVSGRQGKASLSASGLRTMNLIAYPD